MGTPVPNSRIEQQAAEVNNEVITYILTPEEVAARYGPPSPRTEDSPFHARVMQAVKISCSAEEAAGFLKIPVGQLKQYLGRRNIFPDWKIDTEEAENQVKNVDPETKVKGSRLDVLRGLLTKEQYMAFKDKQKLSDWKILKQLGMDTSSLPTLTKLKKEWGLNGVNIRRAETVTMDEYMEGQRAAEALGVFLGDLGFLMSVNAAYPSNDEISDVRAYEAVSVFLRDLWVQLALNELIRPSAPEINDDDVAWATPFKAGVGRATLRVHDKGVTVNSHALTELGATKHIRIGVKRGAIIVMPTDETDPQRYTVGKSGKSREKSSSAKIGGGVLVDFLAKNGVKPGKYDMLKNQAKGWWEAETLGR